ncbi:FMN-dependent NADH-azoreductase [Propionibacterium australiense]|uniref:FMN dependent NADH:quinone oxidoreductase n=1 Tax=Propionibacterium australiense TaxID=119981 RepID=A0A383S6P6_9ACTN|nr:FMN-dependent NADH-azoreductase [Propionibacterium australiense]RLP07694.1 FMN-dependent NADH-azoreductase [Propionibacterium australiense]RLP08121.1 FMN-dependent NADH-azoreductase [Propionibacterium australiense]SYZ33670.1 FMN-dependent NADH-azoreductase [azoR] [Propionibacterium australiense]VEH92972.1 FMN-dependent NADH-azoreductase [Propionibacterium australiense]
MTTVLIVRAHVLDATRSHSMKGLDRFIEVYSATHPGDTLEVLDVYDGSVPEIDADIVAHLRPDGTEPSPEARAKAARFDALTDQFLAADKIVIANPLWNLNLPVRLHAWIDTICVAGKTFAYTEQGPAGLAAGKKVLHIQSNGGAYGGNEPGSKYLEQVLGLTGITDITSVFIEGQDYAPDKDAEITAAALARIEEIAKDF